MHGLIALAFALFPSAQAAPGAKVAVCHQDDTGRFNLISISASAVDAHMAYHGDVLSGAYHADADGDGYGDPAGAVRSCPAPGYTLDASDCDDSDAGVSPDAAEACGDGVDNDCDGAVDEECAGVCPCSGWATWDGVLANAAPIAYCVENEQAVGSFWVTTETELGFIAAGGDPDAGIYQCFVMDWPSMEANGYYGSEADIEACMTELSGWLDRHGALCVP